MNFGYRFHIILISYYTQEIFRLLNSFMDIAKFFNGLVENKQK